MSQKGKQVKKETAETSGEISAKIRPQKSATGDEIEPKSSKQVLNTSLNRIYKIKFWNKELITKRSKKKH